MFADTGGSADGGITVPSGGAALQRVTVVTFRPDGTVVLLRADYSPPAIVASGAYKNRSANARFAGHTAPDDAGTYQPSAATSTRVRSAAQYAKGEHGSAARGSSKGGVIDVYA